MKTKLFILSLLIISFFPNLCKASEMFFAPESSTVAKGDLVKINLFLAAGEDRINAAEGKLIFSSGTLSVLNINFSNSVLNFWPEQPYLQKNGVVSFSGVTPGGFDGSAGKNLLFTVVFKAIKEGRADLRIENASALKDDGAGTESDLKLGRGVVLVVAQSSSENAVNSEKILQELDSKNDTEQPESFTPLVGNDPDIFSGKYFVVFTTNDKKSGIDYYEVQESSSKLPKDNEWIKTESPYQLSDQKLQSFVFIRAFDKAGNARMEIMPPLYPQKFYQSLAFWIIIISGCFAFIFFKKKKWDLFHNGK